MTNTTPHDVNVNIVTNHQSSQSENISQLIQTTPVQLRRKTRCGKFGEPTTMPVTTRSLSLAMKRQLNGLFR